MQKRSLSRHRSGLKGLFILYEDKYILVVDKPAGLLSVPTEREKLRNAHSLLTEYIRRGCGRCRKTLYLVHRLDRSTSGVLIFAKSEEAMVRLKVGWKQTVKKYLAVVHGPFERSEGVITTYLAENKDHIMYSTPDSARGKLSRTAYKVLRRTKCFSLLEVTLLTGRKNQIRAHLAGVGHPIVGDTRYGRIDDEQPRLALHATSISFKHPFSGEQLTLESDVPAFFTALVGPSVPESGIRRSSPTRPRPGNQLLDHRSRSRNSFREKLQ